MSTRKTILPLSIAVCLIGIGVIIAHGLSKSSVKGVYTIISPTPTITPSPTPTPTSTSTSQPLSTKIQPTLAKQYGGWYWQPQLNHAQVWIGTDSAGKDIWVDHSPTPTPTPEPATQQSSTQGAISETSGFSSRRNMIQTLQTKIIEKK